MPDYRGCLCKITRRNRAAMRAQAIPVPFPPGAGDMIGTPCRRRMDAQSRADRAASPAPSRRISAAAVCERRTFLRSFGCPNAPGIPQAAPHSCLQLGFIPFCAARKNVFRKGTRFMLWDSIAQVFLKVYKFFIIFLSNPQKAPETRCPAVMRHGQESLSVQLVKTGKICYNIKTYLHEEARCA